MTITAHIRSPGLTLLLSLRFMAVAFEEVRNLALGVAARGVKWQQLGKGGSLRVPSVPAPAIPILPMQEPCSSCLDATAALVCSMWCTVDPPCSWKCTGVISAKQRRTLRESYLIAPQSSMSCSACWADHR